MIRNTVTTATLWLRQVVVTAGAATRRELSKLPKTISHDDVEWSPCVDVSLLGTEPSPGMKVGPYVIVALLGEGGMGRVSLGYDTRLHRKVALKSLRSRGSYGDDVRNRILREARAAARINHPNVATVYDIVEDGRYAFIVMEYVEGENLGTRFEQARCPLHQVISIARDVAAALDAAHAQGVIHRDLKPGNIVMTRKGAAKVLDFGVAGMSERTVAMDVESGMTVVRADTWAGMQPGTWPYMSPEQLERAAVDIRSDIYSFGVLLFELATGRRPYLANSPSELIAEISSSAPALADAVDPTVPKALSHIIAKALRRDASERFQSAGELMEALDALGGAAHPSQPSSISRRWLGLAVMAVAIAIGLMRYTPLPPGRHQQPVSTRPEVIARPANKARRSVAVIGFKNVSGRSDTAWLSTALSEMFTTELAAGEQLRMVPGESVARLKLELTVADSESFSRNTLERIRTNLDTELVVMGSYVTLGRSSGNRIRLDVRVQDAVAGETILDLAQTGTEANLFELVSGIGVQMRRRLGLADLSTLQQTPVRASLPLNSQGARSYAEGLAQLRIFDALSARDSLVRAIDVDPSHSLAHAALAEAWSALGYDVRAVDEARKAVDLAADLSREDRLSVEGRFCELAHEWKRAIDIDRSLSEFFPDSLDYGLRLAATQVAAGRSTEALETIAALRKLPSPASDDPSIDLAEASVAAALGDHKRRLAAALQAEKKGKARTAQSLVARAEISEGYALIALGDLMGASAKFEDAERVYRLTGDRAGLALALINHAGVNYQLGNWRPARETWEAALSMAREVGAKNSMAMALNNIGAALFREGDLAGARRQYEGSLATRREIRDTLGVSMSLHNIAEVLYPQGNLAEAKRLYHEALQIRRELGNKNGVASTLHNLGVLECASGNMAEARTSYQESLSILKELGQKWAEAETERDYAALLIEEGRSADAERLVREVVKQFSAGGQFDNEATARVVLATSLLAQAKLQQAEAESERIAQLGDKSSSRAVQFATAIVLAGVRGASGQTDVALQSLERTISSATQTGFVDQQFEARLAAGDIEIRSGRGVSGSKRLEKLAREASSKGFVLMARKATAARDRFNLGRP